MVDNKHSPKNFDPSQYVWVGSFEAWHDFPAYMPNGAPGPWDIRRHDSDVVYKDCPGTNWLNAHDRIMKRIIAEEGVKDGNHDRFGTCDHCGAGPLRDCNLFKHIPSGEVIVVGGKCLERFDCVDREEFVKEYMEHGGVLAGKGKAIEFLKENHAGHLIPLIDTYKPGIKALADADRVTKSHQITMDIIRKLCQYGSISVKQIALAGKMHSQYLRQQDWKAKREAEEEELLAAGVSAPTGRMQVNGTVVGIREYENSYQYGPETIIKVFVKTLEGWRVSFNHPSNVDELKRGDVVTLKLTLEPSKDPLLAYGKRPHGCKVLTPANEEK